MALARRYRLKKKSELDQLMAEGSRIKAYPIHLIYAELPSFDDSELKFSFSAPKRIFPSAVDRNRVKRSLRASLRPLIPELESFSKSSGTAYAFMFIYVGKEMKPTSEIEERMIQLLSRFKERINTTTDEQD